MIKTRSNVVYQFRIVLRDIDPTIWRAIYDYDSFNPDSVKFWDPKKRLKMALSSR